MQAEKERLKMNALKNNTKGKDSEGNDSVGPLKSSAHKKNGKHALSTTDQSDSETNSDYLTDVPIDRDLSTNDNYLALPDLADSPDEGKGSKIGKGSGGLGLPRSPRTSKPGNKKLTKTRSKRNPMSEDEDGHYSPASKHLMVVTGNGSPLSTSPPSASPMSTPGIGWQDDDDTKSAQLIPSTKRRGGKPDKKAEKEKVKKDKKDKKEKDKKKKDKKDKKDKDKDKEDKKNRKSRTMEQTAERLNNRGKDEQERIEKRGRKQQELAQWRTTHSNGSYSGGSSRDSPSNGNSLIRETSDRKSGRSSGSVSSDAGSREGIPGSSSRLSSSESNSRYDSDSDLSREQLPSGTHKLSSREKLASRERLSGGVLLIDDESKGKRPNGSRSIQASGEIFTNNPKSCKKLQKKTLELAGALKSTILDLCREPEKKKGLGSDDIDRLKYLYETVHLIRYYMSSQSKETRMLPVYGELLVPLHDALYQTSRMINDISKGLATITENFDIFELTLRRYLEQSNRMFPLENDDRPRPDPPSELIEDATARAVWEKNVGPNVYYTTFNNFIKQVIEVEFPETKADTEFKDHLHYFVNFPQDDMLTTYKWNLLIRLFGPYDDFAKNFRNIVLKRGFLGLINRIKAQELLALDKNKTCVLVMRFSRTEPEFLAFSYKDERGNIKHSLNRDEKDPKKPIAIPYYIRTKFHGFNFVDQKVNVRRQGEKKSLNDYAREVSSAAYIIPAGLDKD